MSFTGDEIADDEAEFYRCYVRCIKGACAMSMWQGTGSVVTTMFEHALNCCLRSSNYSGVARVQRCISNMHTGLCLILYSLWSLVGVQSQLPAPYISFMGETLPNHTFVDLTVVGMRDDNSVQCFTDLQTCCTSSQGVLRPADWYFPNGTLLQFSRVIAEIYQERAAQRVEIHRRFSTTVAPSGLYRCFISTNAVHDDDDSSVRDTIYVGVYANGGN